MSRRSMDTIITKWALSNGRKFDFDKRVDACMELFSMLQQEGYEAVEVKTSKRKVLERMVGHTSKKGAGGLKRWKAAAEVDFNDAYNVFFDVKQGEEVDSEFQTEPEDLPASPVIDQIVESSKTSDSTPEQEPSEDWRAKIRETVETTPVESDEEFMAQMGLK